MICFLQSINVQVTKLTFRVLIYKNFLIKINFFEYIASIFDHCFNLLLNFLIHLDIRCIKASEEHLASFTNPGQSNIKRSSADIILDLILLVRPEVNNYLFKCFPLALVCSNCICKGYCKVLSLIFNIPKFDFKILSCWDNWGSQFIARIKWFSQMIIFKSV